MQSTVAVHQEGLPTSPTAENLSKVPSQSVGYRSRFAVIKVIYNSLDEDVKQADISDIMRALHGVVDDSIAIQGDPAADGNGLYDINKIDFERL